MYNNNSLVSIITLIFCIKGTQIIWYSERWLFHCVKIRRKKKSRPFLALSSWIHRLWLWLTYPILFYWVRNEELYSTTKLQLESPKETTQQAQAGNQIPTLCTKPEQRHEIPLCLSGILQTGLFLLRLLSGLGVTQGCYLNTRCFRLSEWKLKNTCEITVRSYKRILYRVYDSAAEIMHVVYYGLQHEQV